MEIILGFPYALVSNNTKQVLLRLLSFTMSALNPSLNNLKIPTPFSGLHDVSWKSVTQNFSLHPSLVNDP